MNIFADMLYFALIICFGVPLITALFVILVTLIKSAILNLINKKEDKND